MVKGVMIRWLMACALCCAVLPLQAASLKPLISGAYQQIIDVNRGQSFLVALWSVDCPPCHEELALLGDYVAKHPKARIILISTDDASLSEQVLEVLDRYRLTRAENWVFADSYQEKLRFEIDRQWYGELPTSLYYATDGSRQRIRGKLDPDLLNRLSLY